MGRKGTQREGEGLYVVEILRREEGLRKKASRKERLNEVPVAVGIDGRLDVFVACIKTEIQNT